MNSNRAYEIRAAEYFQHKGYSIEITSEQNDWGIDGFAQKGNEKIAIQAKNYGSTSRKISRRALFELYGAMKYFDCSSCAIVTNGTLLKTAKQVAEKLGIEIIYLSEEPLMKTAEHNKSSYSHKSSTNSNIEFNIIWNEQIKALEGIVLTGITGLVNEVVRVDESGLMRITKNGKPNIIPIEAFQWAVNRINLNGFVERDEINQEFPGRLSSGVILVLSYLPIFETQKTPTLRVARV